MTVTALIRFTQGGTPGVAGQAYKGVIGDEVTITNGDNTNVAQWKIYLVYVPPGSALLPGLLASGVSATPVAYFTPDVKGGCYRFKLVVYNALMVLDTDIRNFCVPNEAGWIIPPYQRSPDSISLSVKPDELNIDGQQFGWVGTAGTGFMWDIIVGVNDVILSPTFSDLVTINHPDVRANQDVALLIQNVTPATLGTQQYTPSVELAGRVWDEGASVSVAHRWLVQAECTKGDPPTTELVLSSAMGGVGFTEVMRVDESGLATVGGLAINSALLPTTGDIQVPQIFDLKGYTGGGDCQIIRTQSIGDGTKSSLYLGDSLRVYDFQCYANVQFVLGVFAGQYINITAAGLQLHGPAYTFTSSTATPVIMQEDTGVDDATGRLLLIHAQDCTTGDATVGGNLAIRAGHGVTHGTVAMQDAAGANRVWVDGNEVIWLNSSASGIILQTEGVTRFYQTGTATTYYTNYMQFVDGATSPTITQSVRGAGLSGFNMSVTAQAGGTGDTSGGSLILSGGAKSGTGVYGGVRVPDATHLQLGASAGTGVGAAASQGNLRFGPNQKWFVRNALDTDDINIYDGVDGAGYVSFGRGYGDDTTGGFLFDSTGLFVVRIGGGNMLWIQTGAVRFYATDCVLGNGAMDSSVHSYDYSSGGPWAQMTYTVRGADMTGVGHYGNHLRLRPGKGEHVADDGNLYLTDAQGNNCLTIVGGVLNLYSPVLASGDLVFDKDLNSPDVYQADSSTAAATGYALSIHAQDMTGTGATVGGKLALRAGNGATHGVVALQDADGVDRIYVDANNNGYVNGATYSVMNVGGFNKFYVDSSSASFAVSTIGIIYDKPSPILCHNDDSTSGVTGQTFTMHAQDCPVGTSTGGDLALRGGHGATHGKTIIYDADGTTVRAVFGGHTASLGAYDNDVILNGGSYVYLYVGGSMIAYALAGGFSYNVADLGFTDTLTGCNIKQYTDTTVGGVRPSFEIHAQDSTMAASTGADMIFRAGHGLGMHGMLRLQGADAVDKLTITAAGAVNFAGSSVTATGNPTWDFGTNALTLSGLLTLNDGHINFGASAVTVLIKQNSPAVDVAATSFAIRAQAGGAASAGAGKIGGTIELDGGAGGAGSATYAAGAGANAYLIGGAGGVDGGAGGAAGGNAALYGGDSTGATDGGNVSLVGGNALGSGLHGYIAIGALTTRTVYLGNATDNTAITQDGTGAVTWHGNVDFHNAAITAAGNPTWNTGTGAFTFGCTSVDFAATVGGPIIFQNRTAAHGVIGQTLTIEAQNVFTDGAPGSTGGTLLLKGGPGYGADDTGGHVIVIAGHGPTAHGTVRLRDADGVDRLVAGADVELYGTTSVNLGTGTTWKLAAHATVVYLNVQNLTFQGTVGDVYVGQANAVADADAYDTYIAAQIGGLASVGAGKEGGYLVLRGGAGGAGTAVLDSGIGGYAIVQGGNAGAANGGLGNDGGSVIVEGGTATGSHWGGSVNLRGGWGTLSNGRVVLGETNTSAIHLHADTDFHCSAITATGNPTWNTGLGVFVFGARDISIISTAVDPSFYQQGAAADTAATTLWIGAQVGGAASAGAGKTGGTLNLAAGNGGAGTAVLESGQGGTAYVFGGSAGAANGGVGNFGGNACLVGGGATGAHSGGHAYVYGGAGSGGGADGVVSLGEYQTSQVWIHAPTDFHCSAITAAGNPTWNTGTGAFTVGSGVVRLAEQAWMAVAPVDHVAAGYACAQVYFQGQSVDSGGGAASTGGSVTLIGGTGVSANDLGGSAIVQAGHGLSGHGSVYLNDGTGTWRVCVSDTYTVFATSAVAFDASVSAPNFYQAPVDLHGAAQDLTINAQNNNHVGGGSGGNLYLKGGQGDTDGFVSLYAGNHDMFSARSWGVLVNHTNLLFTTAIVSPNLSQMESTAAGITAQPLVVKAQGVTSGGAASVGGTLYVEGGYGAGAADLGGNTILRAGHGLGANGWAIMQDGEGNNRVSVNAVGEVFLAGASVVTLYAGGNEVLQAFSGSVALHQTGLYFQPDVANPNIRQDESTGTGVGQEFRVSSQTMTGTGSTGGALVIRAGDGVATGGFLYLDAGHGATHGAVCIRDGAYANRIIVGNTGNVEINAASGTSARLWCNSLGLDVSTVIESTLTTIQWKESVSGPVLTQVASTTAAGAKLIVHAQDTSFASARGGTLHLASGSSLNATKARGGDISFETGSGTTNGMICLGAAFSTAMELTPADYQVGIGSGYGLRCLGEIAIANNHVETDGDRQGSIFRYQGSSTGAGESTLYTDVGTTSGYPLEAKRCIVLSALVVGMAYGETRYIACRVDQAFYRDPAGTLTEMAAAIVTQIDGGAATACHFAAVSNAIELHVVGRGTHAWHWHALVLASITGDADTT
jgi:hypothetical protein